MTVRLTSTGLRVADPQAPLDAVGFIDAVLRGVGQVMFQNNSYAGLLFVLGIAWSSPLLALATLLGAATGTATALSMGLGRVPVRDGIFGFNGALVAIALMVFLQPTALTWAGMVVAAAGSTIVTCALTGLLRNWSLPGLTAPFVLTSWCVFLATAQLGRLQPTGLLPAAVLPKAAAVEGVVGVATVADGVFNGVAQVFFQQSVVAGALITLGLLIGSWRAGVAALAGSLTGVLVAWGLGASEGAIRAGIHGFNGVLVAIALGTVFLGPGRRTMGYAALATIATPIVAAAVSAAVQPFGLPGLTLPFVLVTWLFLLAERAAGPLRETRSL